VLVRVRGIYATSITKLLIEGGFSITQPSKPIQDRFQLEPRYDPPDVTIKDLDPPVGVLVLGKCEVVEKVLGVLSKMPQSFIVRSPVPLHAVIVGRVVRRDDKLLVELSENIYARVPSRYVLSEGHVGAFTVVKTPLSPGEDVVVEPDVYITGKYVSIVPGGRILVSKHIGDPEKRRLLQSLGNALRERLGAYGIKFRSSAKYADLEVLMAEIEGLLSKLYEFPDRVKSASPYSVLEEGECIAKILFGREARVKLDDVRNSVLPTARLHHTLKIFSRRGEVIELLDELSTCCSREKSEEVIENFLLKRATRVEVMHLKPWGDVVWMRGDVVSYDGRDLVIYRRLRPGGLLNGLRIPKEEGDYALTCVRRGEWFVVHTYYKRDGNIKGSYVNINTPPEFTKRRILYVDLLVDVVVGEEVRILDVDELETCRYVPSDVKERALSVAGELAKAKPECTERGILFRG